MMNAINEMSWEELAEQVKALPPLTPEQERAHRISFVYGNLKIENDNITRELVEEIDNQMNDGTR